VQGGMSMIMPVNQNNVFDIKLIILELMWVIEVTDFKQPILHNLLFKKLILLYNFLDKFENMVYTNNIELVKYWEKEINPLYITIQHMCLHNEKYLKLLKTL
jgi:hypothetical protein